VYTTTVAAPTAGMADVDGVYGPSGAAMGSGVASLAGTDTITVTVTSGVHVSWGTLGVMTFAVHACAVAMNAQGAITVGTSGC
jgi:hypothetical protein